LLLLLLFLYFLFYIEKMYVIVIVNEYEMMLEYTFTSVCSLYLEII
jgi:hypothetical protein